MRKARGGWQRHYVGASLVVSPKSVAVVVNQKRREGADGLAETLCLRLPRLAADVNSYEAQTVRSDDIERFRKTARNW